MLTGRDLSFRTPRLIVYMAQLLGALRIIMFLPATLGIHTQVLLLLINFQQFMDNLMKIHIMRQGKRSARTISSTLTMAEMTGLPSTIGQYISITLAPSMLRASAIPDPLI